MLDRQCDAQAVEKEVNERLAIMRPYPEVPVKKLLLWLAFAFMGTIATLWLSGSVPFSDGADSTSVDDKFPNISSEL